MSESFLMTDNQQQRIGCIGSGRLYQAVKSYLEQEYQILPLNSENMVQQMPMCSFILYCDDSWHFQTQQEMNHHCLTMGIPWLRAYTEFGVGIIGPCVFPAERGCLLCAEARRLAAMNENDSAGTFTTMRHTLGEAKDSPAQPWLTSNSLEMLAQLVVQETTSCLRRSNEIRTRHALLRLELDTLLCQRHHFLPDPVCPACGDLPPDTAEAAVITLQSRPKLQPFTYRTRSLSSLAKQLFDEYADNQTGLVHTMARHGGDTIAMVTAKMGITVGERRIEMDSVGRTLSYEQSQLAAVAEGLERYAGQYPKRKRTVVQASYRQLGEQALDPTTLGLHTAEQYALPNYRYVPYHHDLVCRWVWGYSFQQQRPILVPEHCAYYGLPFSYSQENAKSCFVFECSSGCALGNCLEEAIFHGIREIAERDSFLMTWYAQLSLPRFDLRSATDPTLRLLIENLEQATGYTIHVFNSTLDHGMTCCFVMAVDEQNRDGMAKVICDASSHPRPESAVVDALLELDGIVKRPRQYFEERRAKALEMLANPMAVREMADHSSLYFLPEAFERFNFLYHSQQQQSFQEPVGTFEYELDSLDLRDDLCHLIDHYLKLGIDIIVVDQTSAEQITQDLRCVKVFMPGMLPMTFGYQHRRISGFKRLSQLPYQLGYRTKPLTDVDINPHPHPFP
jgi:ribosomal protein S12 methylthiotransferase accessory factor